MSFLNYDYPHTRNFDTDLSFLIEEYKQLIDRYSQLIIINTDILNRISQIINEAIANGDIKIATPYDVQTKTLKFIISKVV